VRLLVLAAAYPSPSEPERAVYLENLTAALISEGRSASPPVEAAVVAPRVGPADPLREERSGIAVRRFRYPGRGRRLKEMAHPSRTLLAVYVASALAATLDEARRRATELIAAHWVLPMGPVAAAASALLGIPFVLFAHGSDLNRHASGPLTGRAARWALARAARVFAVSPDLARIAADRFGVPPARLAVLPMGADERWFTGPGPDGRGAKAALGLDPDAPLILFVGDLIAEKGVPELLAAHALLAGRGLRASLALVGDGPLRNGGMAAGSEVGPILLPGRVPQAALRDWYAAADLFVLPSHAEGSPVTVMEALSAGVPVVASRVGGIRELVDEGLTGWLTPPGDTAGLAAVLAGLLASPGAISAARQRLAASPPDLGARRRARDFLAAVAPILEASHGT
jgi:glycosyltransferase involved in cell wall biosynthesis